MEDRVSIYLIIIIIIRLYLAINELQRDVKPNSIHSVLAGIESTTAIKVPIGMRYA